MSRERSRGFSHALAQLAMTEISHASPDAPAVDMLFCINSHSHCSCHLQRFPAKSTLSCSSFVVVDEIIEARNASTSRSPIISRDIIIVSINREAHNLDKFTLLDSNLTNFALGGQNILENLVESSPSGDGTRPESGGERNNSKNFEVIH
ncbi:hypothetical protein TSAR_016284 [Trichomalopsis sarcophagae]|uniref:Uncharacterized protein n=1 Tax=Trichomalopsis sarcophagae TaxID=543379 RepID=A0A232FC91_9HYME|nr:hypothetical protein TSAR_016284 [Trichomalopsis sarcophagae]